MINLTRAKRISGWMSDIELNFLAEVASKSNVIIEIGSYYGRSCMALADNTKGIVYSVDPYDGECETSNPMIHLNFNNTVYKDFLYNLSEHLQSGKVIQFRGIFENFVSHKPADFIFLDGDHSYEGCLKDIRVAMMQINKGGIVSGHDYNTPGFVGVKQSVLETFGEINVVDTIWWIRV